jgi:DNA polymerase III delta subunit
MKKISLTAAALAVTLAGSAFAETFDEAFERNRAMYGAGHTFTFDGKEYVTNYIEDELKAKPANAENAAALIDAAKAKYAESQELGFAWRDTSKYIKQAEEAAGAGEFQKAMDLAARAHYQARRGVEQAAYAEQNWIKAVPPLN